MKAPGVAHPVVSSALDMDILRTLLDDGADGIVLIGADAALEFMSPGALRLFEADGLAAFAGRCWADLWFRADRPVVEAALTAAQSGAALGPGGASAAHGDRRSPTRGRHHA